MWDDYPPVPELNLEDEGTFSWGRSRNSEVGQILVDLGTPNPYFKGRGSTFGITGIKRLDKWSHRVSLEVIESPAESGYIVIHLTNNGTISFDEYLKPVTVFGTLPGKALYRTSGPK